MVYMENLIFSCIVFVLCYLSYIFFVLKRKNVLNKFKNGKELTYLKLKYKISVNDKNIKRIANACFLANSFILSLTIYIVSFFKSMVAELTVGLLTLLILILLMYHIIGICFGKKSRR